MHFGSLFWVKSYAHLLDYLQFKIFLLGFSLLILTLQLKENLYICQPCCQVLKPSSIKSYLHYNKLILKIIIINIVWKVFRHSFSLSESKNFIFIDIWNKYSSPLIN